MPVLLGEGDKAIGARPVERSLGRLHDLPFHLVPGRDDRELACGDGPVVGMVQVERDDRGAYAQAYDRAGRALARCPAESGTAAIIRSKTCMPGSSLTRITDPAMTPGRVPVMSTGTRCPPVCLCRQ